jgi:hypothetical protein
MQHVSKIYQNIFKHYFEIDVVIYDIGLAAKAS